jgi:uncharacterized damage-inducible protein DinB
MTYAEILLPEFDKEMAGTRKVLESIPDDKLAWRAHPRSNTIGWNANHVADLPGWLVMALATPSLDIAPVGGEAFRPSKLTTTREIVDQFDRNVAAARESIATVTDEKMGEMWTLLAGGNVIFTMPRAAVVRGVVLNHLYHHRAHICVYLRLNDLPVPGLYGPSGDE